MNEYRFSMDAVLCFSVRAQNEDDARVKASAVLHAMPDEGVACDVAEDCERLAGDDGQPFDVGVRFYTSEADDDNLTIETSWELDA